MALRKEEFYYDPYEERETMDNTKSTKQLIINVNSELEARIAAMAEQQQISIDNYVEGLLDEVVPALCTLPPARKPLSREGIEKLMLFQEQLLQEHGGKPLGSSVDLLREAREEREKELDF